MKVGFEDRLFLAGGCRTKNKSAETKQSKDRKESKSHLTQSQPRMALGYLWYKVFLRVIKCYKGVEMGWKEKQRGVAEKGRRNLGMHKEAESPGNRGKGTAHTAIWPTIKQ